MIYKRILDKNAAKAQNVTGSGSSPMEGFYDMANNLWIA
jgi:hypothetical protein